MNLSFVAVIRIYFVTTAVLFGVSGCGESDTDSPDKVGKLVAPEAQEKVAAKPGPPNPVALAGLEEIRGVRLNKSGTLPGYILFTPLVSDTTYLINREGEVVHLWKGTHSPSSTYLLESGYLMRGARLPESTRFSGGGQGGRIEKFNWQGEVVWSYTQADENSLLHHDFEPMPNGNVLVLAWEGKTREEAIAAGRVKERTPVAGVWPDVIMEIEPVEPEGGKVVWEWHTWDHIVQNQSKVGANYGEPDQHPRKIDINADPPYTGPATEAELAAQKARGLAPPEASVADRGSDIHHSNAINYNADLDQIAMSVRGLNEIWIIDHGLSTVEAAGEAGDLLYRWGHPENYGMEPGASGLGKQHDIRWIEKGYPGAGNLTAFSNNGFGVKPPRSEVIEFSPARDEAGNYTRLNDGRFGPEKPVWTYSQDGFFSPFISGARRLSNGNTLVTYGPQGRFVEVTSDGDIVWEYWSQYSGDVKLPDGSPPQPSGPFKYAAFRATFIPADHPALAGRELSPLSPQPVPKIMTEEELAHLRPKSE